MAERRPLGPNTPDLLGALARTLGIERKDLLAKPLQGDSPYGGPTPDDYEDGYP